MSYNQFVRNARLTGRGGSQLVQLIRSIGYNRDVDIRFGTIVSPPPDIKLQIDDSKILFDEDDVVVAWSVRNDLEVGSRVIVATIKDGQQHIILDRIATY
jgi:hypothetical protein